MLAQKLIGRYHDLYNDYALGKGALHDIVCGKYVI